MPLARLSVGDVERWHTRPGGMGDAGVESRHGVVRAALAQAVRWGCINRNVAAAESMDPAAALMFRVAAAVSGARRAELAALRWDDLHDGMLTIDSAIEIVSSGEVS